MTSLTWSSILVTRLPGSPTQETLTTTPGKGTGSGSNALVTEMGKKGLCSPSSSKNCFHQGDPQTVTLGSLASHLVLPKEMLSLHLSCIWCSRGFAASNQTISSPTTLQ